MVINRLIEIAFPFFVFILLINWDIYFAVFINTLC
jgi:hypothetical protein